VNKLLKKLLGLLFPGIDGEPDDDPLPDDLPASDPVDDDDLDLPADDLPDDPPVRQTSRRDDSAERLARLEAEVERRGRLAAEARLSSQPTVDPEHQREEERLRNPDTSEMERWQIQANRTLRDTQRQAQQAMFQAQDMSDRTRFESKIASEPRRAKYTERVEEEVQKARSRGQQASREDVYYWMLGKDIAEGKLKAKPKTSSAPAVNRGKTAGVRSDVPARSGRSDKDKLRARLENQNI
jgi:hypothetical protein